MPDPLRSQKLRSFRERLQVQKVRSECAIPCCLLCKGPIAMLSDMDYSTDTEFSKLLIRDECVDLTRLALELARDAYPDINFSETIEWIAACVAELAGPVAAAWSESDAMRRIAASIAETHGIFGDASAYSLADSSYLHRVIQTRRGRPISLSVLYMGVARASGIELLGVAAPKHFLTRFESAEGPLFVDAFHKGHVMTKAECVDRLTALTGLAPRDIAPQLKPVGPRCLVLSLLANLKKLYTEQEAWAAARSVQQRLVALQPGSYSERRDLGLVAAKSHRPAQAIRLLEDCLKVGPQADAPSLESHLRRAERQLAQWN